MIRHQELCNNSAGLFAKKGPSEPKTGWRARWSLVQEKAHEFTSKHTFLGVRENFLGMLESRSFSLLKRSQCAMLWEGVSGERS